MPRPRRTSLTTALAVALLPLTACGAGPGSAEPGTLRIAGPFEVHSLEPALDGEVFTRLQVTETLVTSDLEGELAPGLATAWSSSRGHTRWELDLVEGATFHDGSPLTGPVVATALERAAAEPASPLADVPVTAVEATAASVVIELSRPSLTLPAVLTHYSTAVLAPSSYDEQDRVAEVVGTGPYRLTDVELPGSLRATRFEDYRGEAPEVRDVVFDAVGRAESRALLATSEQADVVLGLEPAGRERVEATTGVAMASSLQPRTIMLKVNAEHPALSDVRVRRALSLALDREAMAQAVLREPELAATQLLPPSLEGWHTDVEPLDLDLTESRALLARAGWVPGAGGVLERNGEPLRLELLTYPDRAELPSLATAVQAALAQVGVDVRVEVTSSSEVPARQADGSLELALVAKHFALVSDPLIDVAEVFAPGGSDWGVTGWRDPQVDQAVTALLAGAVGADADRHRATIVRRAQEQLPLIPVAWYRMNAAVNDRVEGFVLDPLETTWRISDLRWAS